MKYCIIETQSHPLSIRYPNHLRLVNEIIKDEHGDYFPFTNEVAIQLDKVKESAKDDSLKFLKSMDMVLGVKDEQSSSTLLVELKLDCKDPKNLKESDLRDKIKGSKLLLFGSGIPVYNEYIFVFNDRFLMKEGFRSIISRKLANAKGIVLNIQELKNKYF